MRIDAMIHPHAAADVFMAPLHRSFLLSCFFSGAAVLLVLPLHLALAGPPDVVVLVVLAWMLAQWPLALYLSRSGALDRAMTVSCTLFACAVAAVCGMTGGLSSFALVWMLVPPVEAALSGSRSTVFRSVTFCAALLCGLAFLPAPLAGGAEISFATKFAVTLSAVLYVGLLGIKLAADRTHMQQTTMASIQQRNVLSQSIAEAVCELDGDSRLRPLGGPWRTFFGTVPSDDDENWLFDRVHVADRPLYLTHLADAKSGQERGSFTLRLRIGASMPGEEGRAQFLPFDLAFRQSEAGQGRDDCLLSLRPSGDRNDVNPDLSSGLQANRLFAATRAEATHAFNDILKHADALEKSVKRSGTSDDLKVLHLIKNAGEAGRTGLELIADGLTDSHYDAALSVEVLNVNDCLERCVDVLGPLAAERSVRLELNSAQTDVLVVGQGQLLRQSLCLVIADMVETSGGGATVRVSVEETLSSDAKVSRVVFSVHNPTSPLSWSADGSRALLRFANGLFERFGGKLSIETTLGLGERVTLELPGKSSAGGAADADDVTIMQLVKAG